MSLPTGMFYLISHYGAGLPLNRIGSGAYVANQKFSLYDLASNDQQFRIVSVNGKQRIAMNGNTSLGLNVLRTGNNPCTLYQFVNNDNDTQVTIEEASVSGCYIIYLTYYGKAKYTLTAPSDLKSTSANVVWCPYVENTPEQVWRIKTSHEANVYSGHGRQLPAREPSQISPYVWPCYKKTGARGFIPNSHYGIDRDAYYKQGINAKNAPGDPIYPICSGTVVKVLEKDKDFGNCVWIASPNPTPNLSGTGGRYFRHLYLHMNGKPLVAVGASVNTNTCLGYMGTTGDSTGVHLHFGIQSRNEPYTSSDGYTRAGFFNPEIILK